MKLSDAKALITGGGTVIGLAVAERIRDAGGQVVICGRREDVVEDAAARIGDAAIHREIPLLDDAFASSARQRAFAGMTVLVAALYRPTSGPCDQHGPRPTSPREGALQRFKGRRRRMCWLT